MRNLYARFVLWLIRPALELHHIKTMSQRHQEVDETIFKCIAYGNSSTQKGLEYVYGISRPGR